VIAAMSLRSASANSRIVNASGVGLFTMSVPDLYFSILLPKSR
jgi:hypothetical protein